MADLGTAADPDAVYAVVVVVVVVVAAAVAAVVVSGRECQDDVMVLAASSRAEMVTSLCAISIQMMWVCWTLAE